MYVSRLIESDLNEAIRYSPAILLTGARQVGKSTLCLHLKNYNYITLDNITAYQFALNDQRWAVPMRVFFSAKATRNN